MNFTFEKLINFEENTRTKCFNIYKDSFDDESEASVNKRSIKRQRKPPARSKTHTGFTMKNEAGLNRKQSPGLDALVLTLLTVNEGNEKPPKSPKSVCEKC
jgi:hypothetical protein